MISSHKEIFINIGFLFLALIPIAILAISKGNKDNKVWYLFAGTGVLGWLLWALLAKGVIWYGFSIWIFLLLGVLLGMRTMMKGSSFSRGVLGLLVVIFVAGNFFIRTNKFLWRTSILLPNLTEFATEEEMLEKIFPELPEMAGIINEDLKSTIYLTDNAYLKYYITRNDKRVAMDHFLDTFNCIYGEGQPQRFADYLRESGVDFIVIRHGSPDPNFPAFLALRNEELLNLAIDEFTFLTGNGDDFLFKVD